MSGVTVPVAQLLALLLESLLNGVFFTLFIILVLLLSHSAFPNRIYRHLLIPVACIMMTLSTAHLLLGFIRVLQAFTPRCQSIDHPCANPDLYYSNFGMPLQTAKTYMFIGQTLLGDGVMIWRSYVVWNKSKIVLLLSAAPVIANLSASSSFSLMSYTDVATLVFGIMGAISYIRNTGDLLEQNDIYLSTFIAITLAVNISCSAAVVYRIWRSSKGMQDLRKVFPILGAIIQSGALYASAILAVLISYLVKSNGVYAALDIIVPLVGIVFSLIVLQIHFHLHMSTISANSNAAEQTSNLPTLGTLPRWRHYFSNTREQCQPSSINGMPDARYQLQYSREDIDIDRISMSSDIDARIKSGSRVPPQR
ncbi:hypothetical protein NP233_g7782 [Leucocoprinus birnbaumii]|uniref:Uncharacterized protein n=1 Tax=Leucocoprinus birnbaumii TaxID=56174 RepID=A0AAD5YUE7_9AGAR|nr:hypothetical protein NP233_g7782 [Leucocoprinus birnbaumii]